MVIFFTPKPTFHDNSKSTLAFFWLVHLFLSFPLSLAFNLFVSWKYYQSVSSVAKSCRLFATPWTAARQASLSTNSWILLNSCPLSQWCHPTILSCHPFLLLPSIFPSIRVFSNESALRIRWPKYWTFSFNISPSNEYSGLISFRMDWLDLLALHGTVKSLLQHHSS